MIETWEIVKIALHYAVYPVVMIFGYLMKKYIHKIETLEKELSITKTRTAVIESKVDDIRDDIKEIKRGVEKLVERKL